MDDAPKITHASEFAQEVTREILRQNAAILKAILNPPLVYRPPSHGEEISGKELVKRAGKS